MDKNESYKIKSIDKSLSTNAMVVPKETNNETKNVKQIYNLVRNENSDKSNQNDLIAPTRSKIKAQSFESSLILMHKFFKEQKIYSDPNDNFKRRTVVLVRAPKKSSSSSNLKSKTNLSDSSLTKLTNNSSGEFGFNLQTYGLLNSVTKDTEYICFVNNVQPKSPAKRAGLNNGDVLLAIDGLQIDQFKSFIEITKHVKGKNELRLVVMAENVCKKIQYQQRIEQIKKILADKKLDLDGITKQEELILKKYGITYINMPSPVIVPKHGFSTPNVNSMSSSTSSSNSANLVVSPANESTFMSPNLSTSGIVSESSINTSTSVSNSSSFSSSVTNSSLTNSKNMIIIKNSTPNENFTSYKHANFMTSPTGILDESDNQSGFMRSSSGTSFIKVIKPNEHTSKSKSLAKKYFQQTSRLVRSASSSSLNLLNNFKSTSEDKSDKTKKIILKDATVTSSSTDDASYSILISSNAPPNKRLSVDSQNDSFLNRIVKLNSNHEGNFSKKKSLFNKLNSSSHTFDYSFNRANSLINRDSNSRKNSLTLSSKNALFNILSNKPKISKTSTNEYASIKTAISKQDEQNVIVQMRSKSLSSPSKFFNNENIGIARIRSNGGANSSYLDQSEIYDQESSLDQSSLPIPLIDYSNEDYVVTRL